ncbi:DUF397 domain-containing protein [Catellatospora sp. IY07-71]|uniref:DUF397 domain-containing protein n=1 Tax=Catellatospora sp. IY07-71 TaxID=2728827 RepID=UPI001BB314CD|nr:DUF397 domain-containing protein [Catellatospora sp. IY07-71]
MSVVETPTGWVKSSYCDSSACVEVALAGQEIAVRDGKNPQGPVLRFSRQEWQTFVAGVGAGDFASR